LHIELLFGLDRHKAHVLLGHRFSDCFRIDEVVLYARAPTALVFEVIDGLGFGHS